MSDKKPEAAPAAEKAGGDHGAPAGGGGMKALMPAIIAIVMAPAATWGVAQFVLLPKFTATMQAVSAPADENAAAAGADHAAPAAAHGEPPKAAEKEKGGKDAKPKDGKASSGAATGNYKFENIVVNLSGTMGTRYLKVSFQVIGKPEIADRFETSKPQLIDVTLSILSALTLADLEESGSKNILRERLVAAYNDALGGRMVENLFFSEFVVQ